MTEEVCSMSTNKHRHRYSKRLCRKYAALVISLALIFIVGIGSTVAYILTHTDPVKNTFVPAAASCEIEENFDGDVKTDVKVKNTGSADAYVRASIVVTWVDESGNVSSQAPVLGTDYTMTLDLTNGWVRFDDGFYYYTKALAPSAETSSLIDECKMADSAVVPNGCHLSVEIIASAIQAEPASAVSDMWGVVISDGSVTKVEVSE